MPIWKAIQRRLDNPSFAACLSWLGNSAVGSGWIADNGHLSRLHLLGGDDERLGERGWALGVAGVPGPETKEPRP